MKNHESGQALAEFVLILPLFFIAIVGVFSLFLNGERVYRDSVASLATASSQASFSAAERQANGWSETAPQKLAVEKVFNATMNARAIISNNNNSEVTLSSREFESKESPHGLSTACSPSFKISEASLGKVTTCAGNLGYENQVEKTFRKDESKGFRIAEVEGSLVREVATPLVYLGTGAFSFQMRNEAIAFAKRTSTSIFEQKYAATGKAQRSASNFNRDCFLNYWAHPKCDGRYGPLYVVLEQNASASAHAQILACTAEGFVEGNVIGAVGSAIWNAFGGGEENPFCGVVTRSIKALRAAVEAYVGGVKESLNAQESLISADLMTYVPDPTLY